MRAGALADRDSRDRGVELAEDAGLTLVGFLCGPSMNVYAGPGRMTTARERTCRKEIAGMRVHP